MRKMMKLVCGVLCVLLVSGTACLAQAVLRPGPEYIVLDDIYNNELFEITKEYDSVEESEYEADAKNVSFGKKYLFDGYYDGMKFEPVYTDNFGRVVIKQYDGKLNMVRSNFVDINQNTIEFAADDKTEYAVKRQALIYKNPNESAGLRYHLYSNGYMFITPTVINKDYQSNNTPHAYMFCYDTVNNVLYQLPLELGEVNARGEAVAYETNIEFVYEPIIGQSIKKVIPIKKYDIKLKKCPIISVFYNEDKILFDQLPVIQNGRTLVPVRAIFEKIGADVQWNAEERKVTAVKGNTTVELTIDDVNAKKNGAAQTLEAPATILNGRTMVPLRFAAEAFGADVAWDPDMRRVTLTAK